MRRAVPMADPPDARLSKISAIARASFRSRRKRPGTIFSLPIYPHLKDEEVDEVIEVVRAAI